MSRFRNLETGVVVSVSDDKDGRFETGYEPADEKSEAKSPARKTTAKKSASSSK